MKTFTPPHYKSSNNRCASGISL